MAQLSLYIDDETLKKLELAAKIEHLSLSRYVVKKLGESLQAGWPEHFADLFGCVDDETFTIDRAPGFEADSVRELL